MIPATAEDIYKFFSVLDLRTNRGVTLIFCGDNLVLLAQNTCGLVRWEFERANSLCSFAMDNCLFIE